MCVVCVCTYKFPDPWAWSGLCGGRGAVFTELEICFASAHLCTGMQWCLVISIPCTKHLYVWIQISETFMFEKPLINMSFQKSNEGSLYTLIWKFLKFALKQKIISLEPYSLYGKTGVNKETINIQLYLHTWCKMILWKHMGEQKLPLRRKGSGAHEQLERKDSLLWAILHWTIYTCECVTYSKNEAHNLKTKSLQWLLVREISNKWSLLKNRGGKGQCEF